MDYYAELEKLAANFIEACGLSEGTDWAEMARARLHGDISGRVYFLYLYGRKSRTRKKQIGRMRKEVKKHEHMAGGHV